MNEKLRHAGLCRSVARRLSPLLVLVTVACGGSDKPAQPPPQPMAPAPGAPAYPQQPIPGQPVAPGQPPAVAVPPPSTAPTADPIALRDLGFLRQKARDILAELVAALPPQKQQRVAGIPLVVDDTPGEVNAFASCSSGRSAMAITDGLLLIEAGLAQAQAHDELFGSRTVDAYIQTLASGLRPNQPVPAVPAGLFPGAGDPRVIARQHQVLEEQIAFVMGHELGHHHLGHLPCTASPSPLGAGDAARVLSSAVPLFNQPNEIAADLAGTYNVLDAGRLRAARGAFGWTEAGGLLTMRFFGGLSQMSPEAILTAFERSHPPPQLRTPIIQQAAGHWRATGGNPLPVIGL